MHRKNRDEMYHKENYDKKGNLISYRLKCSIKNPKTDRFEQHSMTWRIPDDLIGKKEIVKALREQKLKFRTELEEIINGKKAQNGTSFIDYSKEWLKDMERTKSESYCNRISEAITLFEQEFGKITFDKLNPEIVKSFYKKLMEKDIRKVKISLKKSISNEIINKYKTKINFCKQINLARATLSSLERGVPINEESMTKVCNSLNIKALEYFNLVDDGPRHYKKESIMKYKRIMCTIFNNAVRDRVLEENYTSNKYLKLEFHQNDYSEEIDETKVLNKEETNLFLQYLDDVKDIRWKAYFGTILVTGLRSCEMNGLRWKDIDFEKRTMSVERDRLYNARYGIVENKTKTITSKRKIPLSKKAINVLRQYKNWYDKYVSERPGLYEDDHLMISLQGGLVHPCTPKNWFNKLRKIYGIKKTTVHYLRHTFISMCLAEGIPVSTVSALAGHANSGITLKVYAHYIKETGLEAMEKIDKLFAA